MVIEKSHININTLVDYRLNWAVGEYVFQHGFPVVSYSWNIAEAWKIISLWLYKGYTHPMIRYDTDRPTNRQRWTVACGGFRAEGHTVEIAICRCALKIVFQGDYINAV